MKKTHYATVVEFTVNQEAMTHLADLVEFTMNLEARRDLALGARTNCLGRMVKAEWRFGHAISFGRLI